MLYRIITRGISRVRYLLENIYDAQAHRSVHAVPFWHQIVYACRYCSATFAQADEITKKYNHESIQLLFEIAKLFQSKQKCNKTKISLKIQGFF